jgi:hypothetical protein
MLHSRDVAVLILRMLRQREDSAESRGLSHCGQVPQEHLQRQPYISLEAAATCAVDALATHISQVAGAATKLRLGYDSRATTGAHALYLVGAADAAARLADAIASMPRLARLDLSGPPHVKASVRRVAHP